MYYYDKGYMPDWINKRLKELNLNEVVIDLYTGTSTPPDFVTEQISVFFPDLKRHLENRLVQFGFDPDFIAQGIFNVHTSNTDVVFGSISIQCILTTRDGRILESKIYKEKTYPIADSFFTRLFKKYFGVL